MTPAARQLHLFKSRRQRGTAAPLAAEYQLHCAVVDTIMPGGIFTHIASGEKREKVTAARLKRMGVAAGFPDLIFFGVNGEVACVELKEASNRLSEAHQAMCAHLEGCGFPYLCTDGVDQAIEWLKDDGDIARRVRGTVNRARPTIQDSRRSAEGTL
jgi:hypothetical protein